MNRFDQICALFPVGIFMGDINAMNPVLNAVLYGCN